MKLDKSKAISIIKSLQAVVTFDISIVDHTGVVIQASPKNIVGELNQDALAVIRSKTRKVTVISAESDTDQCDVQGNLILPILVQTVSIGAVSLTGTLPEVFSSEKFIKEIISLVVQQEEKPYTLENAADPYKQKSNIREADFSVNSKNKEYINDPNRKVIAFIVEASSEKKNENISDEQSEASLSIFYQSIFKDEIYKSNNKNQLIILHKLENNNWDKDISAALMKIQSIAKKLSKLNRIKALVSCGNYYDGKEKIQEAYQSALKTLFIGKSLYPKKSVYLYTEMALDVLLFETIDDWSSKYMINAYESLSGRDKNDCLKKTLDSLFYSNLNIGKAAENLNIHRNTLRYRMDKIKDFTGLDISKLENMLILYSAVRLNKLNMVNLI